MFPKLALVLILGVALGVHADEPERIVGGSNAALGEFPYQVSLRRNGEHFCGGTLISNIHVVTAAHCIVGIVSPPYSNMLVVTGAVALNNGGEAHQVADVQVHPNYVNGPSQSWLNDIAIITLAGPVQFNAYQAPIPVAAADPPVGSSLILSGWGRTITGGPTPNDLQKAVFQVISNQQCQQSHPGMPIYNTHLCAFLRQGVGACQGDSGGPLVFNGQLTGITSWVVPCAQGRPDVYTRASHYRDFIYQVTGISF